MVTVVNIPLSHMHAFHCHQCGWGGSWRLPDIQAQNIVCSVCLLSVSGSQAEQTVHSAWDSHVFSFLPCKLLKGREEAVSLQSHLRLSYLPTLFQEVKLLHKQNMANGIHRQTFSSNADQTPLSLRSPEREVTTLIHSNRVLSSRYLVIYCSWERSWQDAQAKLW